MSGRCASVENDLDATKVHFQGAKLHALAYRPVNDDTAMVVKAVLAAAAVRATATVFNDVFGLSSTDAWQTVGGVDFGDAVATRNGTGGDRELLFLGHPANMAAGTQSMGTASSGWSWDAGSA